MGRLTNGRRLSARFLRFWLAGRTPRPFVAFAATDEKHARQLYRAQNIIWVWLGAAAVLSAVAWLVRPTLGIVLVTHDPVVDWIRYGLFCYGGLMITTGVWWIHREIEVFGHVLFATGALITAVVTATASLPGSPFLQVALTSGLAISSTFRAFYLVRWIAVVHTED